LNRRTFRPEIFVISAAALLLEISYTRIISFKLYYYYTYLVIGLALLGLGSGAVIVAISKRLQRTDTTTALARCVYAAAGTAIVGYLAVALTPLDTLEVWTGTRSAQLVAVGQLLVICLGLYVTFLPLGMAVSLLLARRADDINRVYFADLAGAALACLVVVPLIAWVGPQSLIAIVTVVLAALGLYIGAADRAFVGRRAVQVVTIAAALVVLVPAFDGDAAPEIRTEESKGLRPDTPTAASEWSALFRVDALPLPEATILYHDGIWGSAVWPWDGDPESLTRFDDDDRSIPFAALGEPPERVLIIGAAGGNEIAAALHFGAEHVEAVELNPATARLLRGQFADYSGDLTEHPNVDYVVGDGRSYLARSDEAYDLVWFVAPDSYAASNAGSSGAFVLSESYLYTEEMLREALDHLAPDGLVVMQFGEKDYENRPNRTARLASTARAAFDGADLGPLSERVVVTTTVEEGFFYGGSTTILAREPFDDDALDRIVAQASEVPNAAVRYAPGRPGDDGAPVNQVITLPDDELRRFVDAYPYDIRAIDDNRPFFWHFTPFSQVIADLGEPLGTVDVEIAIGERVLLLLLGVSIVLAAVFLLLPFVAVRDQWRQLPDKATSAPIFALLGIAFIAIEVVLIQRLSLFLGYPTYSLTVTLMAILLSAGVGALVSGRWHARPRRMLTGLAIAIVALGVLYSFVTPWIEESLQSLPTLTKAAIVVVLCAPLGFCLGMFMPFTISLVARDGSPAYVAWGWAINGFFSVIGSTLTTIVSMTFGFRSVLFGSVVLYLIAVVLLARLAGRHPSPPSEIRQADEDTLATVTA
jgi:hypothetical protein